MNHHMDSWALWALGALLVPLLIGCMNTSSPESLSFIEYHRSGGFGGLDDHLIIHDDGTAVLTRKRARSTFTLDEAAMDELHTLLGATTFHTLRETYLPSRESADLFDYVITHDNHTVRTKDTAVPETLLPLLERLDQIIATR